MMTDTTSNPTSKATNQTMNAFIRGHRVPVSSDAESSSPAERSDQRSDRRIPRANAGAGSGVGAIPTAPRTASAWLRDELDMRRVYDRYHGRK